MWQFTERFMEECIEANPSAFLNKHLDSYQRQLSINGFRPDLLLKDTDGKIVIVEIQQRALDRYHLYKTLEYRDLVPEHFGVEVSVVILVCEAIDERYERLLQTHNVSLIKLERNDFIAISISNCPDVVHRFLTTSNPRAVESDKIRNGSDELRKLRFLPLDWSSHLRPHDILRHLHEEFGRLGVSVEDIPRSRYRQIYYDAWSFLEQGAESIIKNLLVPSHWNFQKLHERGKCIRNVHNNGWEQIAKPRVHLFATITVKHNFRAFWYPTEYTSSFVSTEENDWVIWCGDGSYGWSRPHNELLFLRDVDGLQPGYDDSMKWDDRVNWDTLDEIFVALVYSCYRYLIMILTSCLDLRVHTGIEVTTRGVPSEQSWNGTATRICGWSLFSYEMRQREKENEWLGSFEKQYGLSVQTFLQTCQDCTEKHNRNLGNIARYVSRDLAAKNIRIAESQVKKIIERLKSHHSYLIADLEGDVTPPSSGPR